MKILLFAPKIPNQWTKKLITVNNRYRADRRLSLEIISQANHLENIFLNESPTVAVLEKPEPVLLKRLLARVKENPDSYLLFINGKTSSSSNQIQEIMGHWSEKIIEHLRFLNRKRK